MVPTAQTPKAIILNHQNRVNNRTDVSSGNKTVFTSNEIEFT